MDSVEVSFDGGADGDPRWAVYLQSFRPEDGGLMGAQEWHGPGFAIAESAWLHIRSATMAALERMVLRDGLVQVHCDAHQVVWCEDCRTTVWEPAPFD